MQRNIQKQESNPQYNKINQLSDVQKSSSDQSQQQVKFSKNTEQNQLKKGEFQAHGKDPNNRFNKFFQQKYDNSMPFLKQFQQEREQLETPFINAQKQLQEIVQNETLQFNNSNTNRSSQINTLNRNNASLTTRSMQQRQTLQSSLQNLTINKPLFQIDKKYLIMMEEFYGVLIEYSENLGKMMPPNFQEYWQIVFQTKLEEVAHFKKDWTFPINQAILLDAAVVGIAQCLWGKLYQRTHSLSQSEQASLDILKGLLSLAQQNLLIIIDQLIQANLIIDVDQNVWTGTLDKIIEAKKIRNLKNDYLFELKRNNEFMEFQIKNLLQLQQIEYMSQRQPNYQENKGQISTIYLIVQHSLKVRKSEDVTKLRENIVNATFLTMMRPNFQNESPLKNIYLTFEDPQSQEHIFEPELSQDGENQRPQPPFLQPKSENSPEYTLVLDLDETLGHFDQTTDKFNRRPFLNEFMQSIHGNFEIVIFTAGIQEYADQVLQDIDPDNIVQHRLYRHHTNFEQGNFIKDLTLLGRDLSKTIIVDNNHTNFKYQPENAIFIRTWINEEDDQELIYLKNLLQKIGKQKQEDLRQSLQQYRDYIVMQIARGVQNPEKKI